MQIIHDKTIVAISTPPGLGGIAIIRMSGPNTISIIEKIFVGKRNIAQLKPWKANLGKIYDEDVIVDEVLMIFFKAPNSYTREDMAEISCHGGVYVSKKILELLIAHGAKLAKPGEFTFRAFINGRLDLSQAEAVSGLIQAKTAASLHASMVQLEGKLSSKILEIRSELVNSCALLELQLDFVEEDVEFINREDLIYSLNVIEDKLLALINTQKMGRIAREGIKVVIAGKPNVGKSSLLNRIVDENRAIVNDIPGTTRDVIEVQIELKGFLIRIFDTAGIKTTDNPIENEGIIRAKKMFEMADIILHVFDGSKKIEKEDSDIMVELNALTDKKVFRLINKIDKRQRITKQNIIDVANPLFEVSAQTGEGIERLKDELITTLTDGSFSLFNEEIVVTEIRHVENLRQAVHCVQQAKMDAMLSVSPEFISVSLREALDYLGQIIGAVTTSEDILNTIFSKFCIGK